MRVTGLALALGFLCCGTSAAFAACEGGLGRGWAGGNGAGKYAMAGGDKSCLIGFPAFINDGAKTKVAADQIALRRAPKNGSIGISAGQGIVYTPAAGFRGEDKFCIRATAQSVKGQSLSGCVTVKVP